MNIERLLRPLKPFPFRKPTHRKDLFWLFLPVLLLAFVLLLGSPETCIGATKRLVVLKVDGLPYNLLDSFVRQRDPRSGKSKLPWIDHIFYQRGTRLANFYVRGTSLSAP